MTRNGIPVDAPLYREMKTYWEDVKRFFIERDGAPYRVYEGTTFRQHLFAALLDQRGIEWPLTPSSHLKLDGQTWRERTRMHPELEPLRVLTTSITDLKINELPVASDGRARCWLAPFWTATGRNQPSPAQFLYAMPGWLRALIRPAPGHGVAYLDFSSQEIAIMAALSGDPAMREDVLTGDPYLSFGVRAKLIPDTATKRSHTTEREQLKRAVLGPQYGMTAYGLAALLKVPLARARELLARHQALYATFYGWQRNAVATAQFTGSVSTEFGWSLRVGPDTKSRTIMNFFAQATGAEMMRAAAIAATEAGLRVNCSVHDAFLIEARLSELDDAIEVMRKIMTKAAMVVTNGLPIKIEADTVVRWPDRYPSRSKGGRNTWSDVLGVLERLGAKVA
jgi:DNA polymerase I